MEASAPAHEVAQRPPARSGSARLVAMLFLGSVVALYVAIAYTLYTMIVAVA